MLFCCPSLVPLGAMGRNATAIKGMQGRGFQKEALRQPPAGGPQTLTPMGQAAVLRSQHLSRLATWASATVPPLGALLGARLGCWCEAVGAPAPPSPHVTCERSNFFILLIHCQGWRHNSHSLPF